MGYASVSLPAPAANGSGAAVDTSGLGTEKTIAVKSNGATVLIEVSNQGTPTKWAPLAAFPGGGSQVINVSARWMRATVMSYDGGAAPVVDVGAQDVAGTFAELVAPAGNGAGAGVDTSALPLFKTVHVAGVFEGAVIIEVSEDGGTSYQTLLAFQPQQGGIQSASFSADFMRVSRNGCPTSGAGTPLVFVGGTSNSEGGGGGDINVDLDVVAKGNGSGGLINSAITDDSVNAVVQVIRPRMFLDNGEGTARLQWVSSGGVNYLQSGVDGTPDSAVPLRIGSMGGVTTWVLFDVDGNAYLQKNVTACPNAGQIFTVGPPASLDAEVKLWGTVESGKFTGPAIAGGFYNFIATDYTFPQQQGTGGSYKMQGPYNDDGDIIGAAEMKASKSNGVSGDVGHDLLFATKTSGGVGFDVRFAIRQTALEVKNTAGEFAYIGVGFAAPEGVMAAPVGSIYLCTDDSAPFQFYVKESGGSTVNGWVGK